MTRLRHWWLAVTTLPLLIFNPYLRSLLFGMRTFCRSLPDALRGPLLPALQNLTPNVSRITYSVSDTRYAIRDTDERTLRQLADIAALLDRRSPLGLCLRRSLTRYHFLRRVGVPVVLQFGAKFVAGKPDREVTGHAWLTLNDEPYYEADENWRGFVVMLSFPSDSNSQ